MKSILFTLLIGYSLVIVAQPNTEVYLFDLTKDENGYQIDNPINISSNDGYDNQPSFWKDGGSILYARTVNGQTEIARYLIASGETKIITNTLQGSEYSPTPMPDGRISSIRLDTTGLQLLYAYDLSGKEEVLVEEWVVGYHAWINQSDIVAFVLGDPMTLQLINTTSNKGKVLADSIGRSIHKIPSSDSFSFVDKSTSEWTICSMNSTSLNKEVITQTRPDSEDYCWTSDGDILMGQGNELWHWNKASGWKRFGRLEDFGLEAKGISRVAASPSGNKIAIVVNL